MDAVGTNDGTVGAGTTWVPGRTNNAVGFNGTASGFVNFPAGLVSALDEFSITAWVKVETNATWARVFDFGTGTGNYMFLAPASGGNSLRYAITTTSNGGEQQINHNAVLSAGIWHHVAVTLSGTVGVLYLDGVAVGVNSNMTLRPSTLGNTTQNYLGKSQWPDPNLVGSVDDFRIYNRALTLADIQSLAIVPAVPTNLTATAGDGQVGLQWSTASRAISYNVKHALASGGPYTTVTNLPGTNFVNAGLANGTMHYFVVSATNLAGESANSIPASARPVSAIPTKLDAVLIAGQLQFSWPQTHTGWVLQSQTNTPGTGLRTNWVIVTDSALTNQMTMPFDPSSGSVFFRLKSPY